MGTVAYACGYTYRLATDLVYNTRPMRNSRVTIIQPVFQLTRRTTSFVATVFLAGSLTFLVPRLPALWSEYGSFPSAVDFANWWLWVLEGGFVSDKVTQAVPWTLALMGLATTVSFIIGSVAGALIASPFGKIGQIARWGTPAALTMYATPYFIFGMILIWLSVWLVEIFPTGGGYTLGETPQFTWHGMRTLLWHGTLPMFSIILTGTAHWLVLMRGMMVTVEGEDYVIQSRAMGLKDWRIFSWYRMRNCALPQFTQLFLSMGIIFTGAVMVEIVFSYPGIGYLLQQAIIGNDSNTVQSIVITTAFIFAVLLAIMETVYPLIDPRIGRG